MVIFPDHHVGVVLVAKGHARHKLIFLPGGNGDAAPYERPHIADALPVDAVVACAGLPALPDHQIAVSISDCRVCLIQQASGNEDRVADERTLRMDTLRVDVVVCKLIIPLKALVDHEVFVADGIVGHRWVALEGVARSNAQLTADQCPCCRHTPGVDVVIGCGVFMFPDNQVFVGHRIRNHVGVVLVDGRRGNANLHIERNAVGVHAAGVDVVIGRGIGVFPHREIGVGRSTVRRARAQLIFSPLCNGDCDQQRCVALRGRLDRMAHHQRPG